MGSPTKDAARAILTHPAPVLNRRSGQFLGGLAYDRYDEPLTDKQRKWLVDRTPSVKAALPGADGFWR